METAATALYFYSKWAIDIVGKFLTQHMSCCWFQHRNSLHKIEGSTALWTTTSVELCFTQKWAVCRCRNYHDHQETAAVKPNILRIGTAQERIEG